MFKLKLTWSMLLLTCFAFAQTPTFYGTKITGKESKTIDKELRAYDIYQLDIKALDAYVKEKKDEVPVRIKLCDEHDWNLMLLENDMRSKDHVVRVKTERGIITLPKEKNKTFKGFLNDGNAGEVRLTFDDDFLYGFVTVAGEEIYVQPLWNFVDNAANDLFIVYSELDVIPDPNAKCGATRKNNKEEELKSKEQIDPDLPSTFMTCKEVELAIANDFLMYQDYGSDVNNVIGQNFGVMNLVGANYDDEFAEEITFLITENFVSSCSSCDPGIWSNTTNPGALLDNFRSWGNGGGFSMDYDLGQLWTDRDFNQGVVGVAYLGVICTGSRYQTNQDYTSNANLIRQLTAHETGHNFDANHVDPSNCIMEPFVNGSSCWDAFSVAQIDNHVATRSCLGACSSSQGPAAAFSSDQIEGCAPLTINFADDSAGGPNSWTWTFEGGTPGTSFDQNPTVTYLTEGVYDVNLEIFNTSGSDQLVEPDYITVLPLPNGTFNSTDLGGGFVNFTNTSTNGTSFFWDFGDGGTSGDPNPTYQYFSEGTFPVTLTIINNCGSTVAQNDVTIVLPPTSGFSSDLTEACTPAVISFLDESTANTTGWFWTFEGGTPANSFDQFPVVVYTVPGTYNVILEVSNSSGDNTSQVVDYVTILPGPIADFTFVENGSTFDFTNTSTDATSFIWNFGDGESSTEENPSHTYAMDGTYDVELIASSSCGNITSIETITILSVPTSGFSANTTSGCVDTDITFTDESSSNVTSWSWDFPGGTPSSSTEPNPTISYANPGTYSVSLSVANAAGSALATETDYIVINTTPTAGFTSSVATTVTSFTNTSDNATTYSWDFGDSNSSTEVNPVHNYDTDGIYEVVLTATNECGSVTTTETITIVTEPVGGFTSTTTSGCAPLAVTFNNASSENVTSWSWDFQGGTPSTSTAPNPSVTYDNPGTYSVTLVVTNAAGSSTVTETNYVVVNTTPTAGFSSSISTTVATFTNTSDNATSYSWDFGDSNSSTDTNPSHTYSEDGMYEVVLTATNECGSVTTTETVTIVTEPDGGFTSTTTSGCAPLAVTFNNTSSENVTSWSWNFPGGTPSTSTAPNPSVTYDNPGTYSVTLVVTNAAGSSTVTETNYVVVNTTPTVGFSSSISTTVATFTNTSDNATSYSWDFGDSNSSTDANPSHTYSENGMYEVVLTATNECGSVTTTETVTIVTEPDGGFTSTTTSGCAPLAVTFNNTSSENVTSWSWNFPGGTPSTSTAPNPSVTYDNPGTYSVTLVVTNAAGSSTVTETNYVVVNTTPTVGFSSSISTTVATFTNTSDNATSYSWDFGDGNNSTSTSPDHTYAGDEIYEVELTATNECGSVTTTETITIVTEPDGGFTSTTTSGCAPLAVTFNNTSSENVTSWSWDFPGGTPSTSTAPNPSVTYDDPGTYSVTLVVTNAAGSSTVTETNYVVVNTTPTAEFSSSVSTTVATFTNTSDNATSYSWDFGDGNNSTSTSPEHTYAEDGTYEVELTATNECGSVTTTEIITITTSPVGDFNANVTNGCAPLTVNFDDQSTANVTSWSWSFPGGSPSSANIQNPTVTYNNTGTYTVTLVVSNTAGSATVVQTDYIIINDTPTASFGSNTTGTDVSFNNTSDNATSYSWDFGDGNNSTSTNPDHTYAGDGVYEVELTATNECGSVTTNETITIVTAPEGDFTANVTSGCEPLEVNFTNQSSENVTSWSWSFPGALPSTSSDPNPTVTYNDAGNYTVTLVVSNAAGSATITETAYIIVNEIPEVGFSSNTIANTVSFTNTSTNANSYEWDFGDGNTSTDIDPTHTYDGDGNYEVTLTAFNECGEVTSTEDFTIVTNPEVGFSANVTTGCAPLEVNFSDLSSENTTGWSWSFSGGIPATSTSQNPTVSYNTPGTYAVTLIVSNASGTSTATQQNFIVVLPEPTASFDSSTAGTTVGFNNTSTNTNAYSWDFGDGNTSTSTSPTHVYDSDGVYEVVLTATGECGTVTTTETITILTEPVGGFAANTLTGCTPMLVNFSDQSSDNVTAWSWDFPGGTPSSSTEQNPTVTYNTQGNYTVTLIVSNGAGESTSTETNYIIVGSAPTADFSNVKNGLTISFTNNSVDGDSYSWDFGDGNTSTSMNPVHTYDDGGNYEVVLTVSNECGEVSTTENLELIGFPSADFSANITTGCIPMEVAFSDLSSSSIDSWEWTFEGGTPTSSTEQFPIVTYSTAGTYSVSLLVTNESGTDVLVNSTYIVVESEPTAAYEFEVSGNTAIFTNNGTNADSYSWNFGNGETSSDINPVYTYPEPGTYSVILTATNDCGSVTYTDEVFIEDLTPLAGFTSSNTVGCAPLNVAFEDVSTNEPTAWNWTFEGGTPATSTEQNPTVVFETPGNYTVTLEVTSLAGTDLFTESNYIFVQNTPENIGFTSMSNELSTSFTNMTTGANSYTWDFGDGNTSTEENPTHIYDTDGTYTVALNATNNCGTVTTTETVVVVSMPVADFTLDLTNGCTPLEVNFSDNSSENTTGWNWTFEGGTPTSSTAQNPVVIFNDPGTYSVTLEVSNAAGNNSTTQSGVIVVAPLPTPGFTSGANNSEVSFVNTTTDGLTYSWDFGDGNMSTEQDPIHNYATDGTYTVTLTATNDCGSVDFVNDVLVTALPIAGFTATVTSGCSPLEVTFDDQSTQNTETWSWAFEGGTPATSTEQNPTVTYNNPGTYNVTLLVSNSAGNNSTTQLSFIVVEEAPIADFTTSVNNLQADFTNNSSNGNTYLWNFGDGNTSIEETPNHIYAMGGTYTVSLSTTNACGTDVTTQELSILSTPVADFSVSQTSGCIPFEVTFADLSTAEITAWSWSFPGGEPATSTDQNPVVVYNAVGTYEVTLQVTNPVGTDEVTQISLITVNDVPVSNFESSADGNQISFTNNSTNATTYEWNFGDGNTSTEMNPVHEYSAGGTYTVTLTATNECGSVVSEGGVDILTDLTEIDFLENFEIFPNPNDGRFTMLLEGAPIRGLKINLINILGQFLETEKVDFDGNLVKQFDWNHLSAGTYIIQLEAEHQVAYRKLVID